MAETTIPDPGPWPATPLSDDRDELIACLKARIAWVPRHNAWARAEHAVALAEWKATIAERLLALIPGLEDGSISESRQFATGGPLYGFDAPRLVLEDEDTTALHDRLAVLEALPDGPVPPSIRARVLTP